MTVFGFDIDDTVADGNSYFVKGLNEFLNKDIKVEDVRGRLNTTYGVDQSVLDEYFYNLGDKVFTDLEPIDESVNSINKLYDLGHTIIFVTARPDTANNSTKEWLEKHGFKYHLLIHSKTKVKECKDLGVKIFVDDHPQIVESMNENGIKAIFVDCPKNRDIKVHPNISRIEKWKEICNFIIDWDKLDS